VHDEGTQILENIANIRVPMIWRWKARQHVQCPNTAAAREHHRRRRGRDLQTICPILPAGSSPGDGVFTLWSYFVGPGRAQAMLLDPQR